MDVRRVAKANFQIFSLPREQSEIQKSEVKLENNSANELITKEKLEQSINKLNEFFQNTKTAIHFRLHEDLQEYYVQIVDDVTQEVVKEIPPKKLLDMYAAMNEFWGILFDKQI